MMQILKHPMWQGVGAIAAVVGLGAGLVTTSDECEEPVFEEVVTPERIRSCRDSTFGVERWEKSEKVSRSSDWRPIRMQPSSWCDVLASDFFELRRVQGPSSVEVLGEPREEKKNDMFGYPVYSYFCHIQLNWEPIYQEAQHPRCGVIPEAVEKKQIGTKVVPCKRTNT